MMVIGAALPATLIMPVAQAVRQLVKGLRRGYARVRPHLIQGLLLPLNMSMMVPGGGGRDLRAATIKFGNLELTADGKARPLYLKITSEHGVHMAPALELAEAAKDFPADIRIHKRDGDSANLKSSLGITSLLLEKGEIAVITFEGEDAVGARQAIEYVLDNMAARGKPLGRLLDFNELVEELFEDVHSSLVRLSSVPPEAEAELPRGFLQGVAGNYSQIVEADAWVLENGKLLDRYWDRPAAEDELKKFKAAVVGVGKQLEREMESRGEDQEGDSVTARNRRYLGFFSAHIQELIKKEGLGTGAAARVYMQRHQKEDGGLFDDIRAIMEDVILTRYGSISEILDQIDVARRGRIILVVSTLTPLTALHIVKARDRVKGVISEKKLNRESHQVILLDDARIPIVTGFPGVGSLIRSGQDIILDSAEGTVVFDLTTEEAQAYFNRRFHERRSVQTSVKAQPVEHQVKTLDGRPIELLINIERTEELAGNDFPGVGLNRTEFDLINNADGSLREKAPSLEELVRNYERFLRACQGRPAVIRTFDFEPTKRPKYFSRDLIRQAIEEGPEGYLVYDGSAETLKFKRLNELFRKQVRAFLMATARVAAERKGDIRPAVMFPMISSEQNFWRAAQVLGEEEVKLKAGGEVLFPGIKIGAMIETPSGVRNARDIAEYADFISVGSNDLKAATFLELGFRDAEEAVETIEGIPPQLLKYIHETARATEDKVRRICCCGVLASSPRYAPLLIGAGINSLSVSRGQLETIAFLVRNITYAGTRDLVAESLGLGTVEEVDLTLSRRFEELLEAGKGKWAGLDPIRHLMLSRRSVRDIIELGRSG